MSVREIVHALGSLNCVVTHNAERETDRRQANQTLELIRQLAMLAQNQPIDLVRVNRWKAMHRQFADLYPSMVLRELGRYADRLSKHAA